ncbi:MAG: flavin reductase family protein, partial [Clostridiales bacterium]|nr:flavin reductase family protein [Clostridiales bacterium]
VQISEKYMNETGKFELNDTGLVAYSHGEYFTLGEKIGKFGYSVKK